MATNASPKISFKSFDGTEFDTEVYADGAFIGYLAKGRSGRSSVAWFLYRTDGALITTVPTRKQAVSRLVWEHKHSVAA